jgi:hypothetical protein
MLRSYVRPYERSISARHHHRKAAFTGGLLFFGVSGGLFCLGTQKPQSFLTGALLFRDCN